MIEIQPSWRLHLWYCQEVDKDCWRSGGRGQRVAMAGQCFPLMVILMIAFVMNSQHMKNTCHCAGWHCRFLKFWNSEVFENSTKKLKFETIVQLLKLLNCRIHFKCKTWNNCTGWYGLVRQLFCLLWGNSHQVNDQQTIIITIEIKIPSYFSHFYISIASYCHHWHYEMNFCVQQWVGSDSNQSLSWSWLEYYRLHNLLCYLLYCHLLPICQ